MIGNLLNNMGSFRVPRVRYTAGQPKLPSSQRQRASSAADRQSAQSIYNPKVSIPISGTGTNAGGTTVPPGAQPGAAPAGATPSTPSSSTLAHDSVYDSQAAFLAAQKARAEGAVPGALGQGAQQYGYSYDLNTGAIAEDASNPYSKRALLVQSYENARRGNTNSAAARGQLYAGSLSNAQDYSQNTYNQSSDALRRSFQGFVQDVLAKRQQAEDAYSQGLINAEDANVQRQVALHGGDSSGQDSAQSLKPGDPPPPLNPGESAAEYFARLAKAGVRVQVSGNTSQLVAA